MLTAGLRGRVMHKLQLVQRSLQVIGCWRRKAPSFQSFAVASLLCASSISLAGCDAIVSTQPNGPSREEVREQSCRHFAYCFTCMPGFDGKSECGMKFSGMCPGRETVRVKVTPMLSTYESGKVRRYEASERLEVVEKCD